MNDALDPQALAEAVGRTMYERDRVSQALGILLEEIRPGYARMRMKVRDDMANSYGRCHGGVIFTLADSAFAYACNSHNHVTVAQGASIEFIAPSELGDELTADGLQQHRGGRIGVYDIVITNRAGNTIALFRGKSFRLSGHIIERPAR